MSKYPEGKYFARTKKYNIIKADVMYMNLLNYLKKIKSQLLNAKELNNKNIEMNNIDNVEIIIENYKNLFENEHEIIKKGALTLLENGNVDNFEEGIIVFATMIRGLKYKKTEKEENGNVKIILLDIEQEKSITKKLCLFRWHQN